MNVVLYFSVDYDVMEKRLQHNHMALPLFVIPWEKNFGKMIKSHRFTYSTEDRGRYFYWYTTAFKYGTRGIYHYQGIEHARHYELDSTFKIKTFTLTMWYYHNGRSLIKIMVNNANNSFVVLRGSNSDRLR